MVLLNGNALLIQTSWLLFRLNDGPNACFLDFRSKIIPVHYIFCCASKLSLKGYNIG